MPKSSIAISTPRLRTSRSVASSSLVILQKNQFGDLQFQSVPGRPDDFECRDDVLHQIVVAELGWLTDSPRP